MYNNKKCSQFSTIKRFISCWDEKKSYSIDSAKHLFKDEQFFKLV